MKIRSASAADAAQVAAIYAPYVSGTTVSFEEVVPTAADMAARITALLPEYPYLVAEVNSLVLGYAYAGQHRTRSAYRTSVDVTVYVAEHAQRSGVGRALYSALLLAAKDRGYHAAFAGIALPNPASVALHEAMGFTPVGIYREVGSKFGRWLDVAWYQRLL